MNTVQLNYILQNGYDSKFYVKCTLLQYRKKIQKITLNPITLECICRNICIYIFLDSVHIYLCMYNMGAVFYMVF